MNNMEPIIGNTEVAEMLGMSLHTWYRRKRDLSVPCVMKNRYRRSDVQKWMDDQVRAFQPEQPRHARNM